MAFVTVCVLHWTLDFLSPSSSNSIAKRLLKMYKRWKKERDGEKEEDDSFVRWERDYELTALSQHGLFFEYLELGEVAVKLCGFFYLRSTITE